MGKLAQDMDLVGILKTHVDRLLKNGKIEEENKLVVFEMLCRKRAESVYTKYHATLPGIKRTSYKAAQSLRDKGYVFNLYGRHRHLPADKDYRAFNSLNQSSAADLMKERTVAVAAMCKPTPIELVASVHDEILFHGPTEAIRDPRTIRDLVTCMEDVQVKLRVPIRVSVGVSDENWAESSGRDIELGRDWGAAGELGHL